MTHRCTSTPPSAILPLMKRAPLLVLLAGLAIAACQRDGAPSPPSSTPAPAPVEPISVDAAAALHKSGGAVFLDANADDFRREHGTVPGAVLLASSSVPLTSLLPASKDTPLVFYCSSRL